MGRIYFEDVNIAKGIAMLLVILGHSPIVYPIDLQQIFWCRWLVDVIYSFHMPCFFLLSGFLFANTTAQGHKNIINKVRRILVPYFCFSILILGIKYIIPSLVNRKVDSIGTYIDKILFYGGEYWFVYVLFFIFFIFEYLRYFLNKKILAYWLLLLLIIVYVSGIVPFASNLFLNGIIVYYSFFFVFGYIFYSQYQWFKKWISKDCIYYSLCFLFGVTNILLIHDLEKILLLKNYILPIIGTFFCWSLSMRVLDFVQLRKIFGYLGKYSLQFYLFNGFALTFVRSLLVSYLNISNSVILVILIFSLCVVLEFVMIEITRKISQLSFFFGY